MPPAEPRLGKLAAWLSLTASFVLSFETWVRLAQLAGYGAYASYAMPAVVDCSIVATIVLWLHSTGRLARLARILTYFAAFVGVAVQSAYHSASTYDLTGSTWRAMVAFVVGAIPPLFAALAVHMRALLRRERLTPDDSATVTPAVMAVAPVSPPVVLHAAAFEQWEREVSEAGDSDIEPVIDPKARAWALFDAGKSVKDIAPIVGRSVETVHRYKREWRQSS